MSFIDASYFVGDLNIPNSGSSEIAERITWFIQKYEPIFLQKLLGYPLYKAFIAGLAVTPPATPDPRLINILYGCEYTDLNGNLQKWKGLIITDSPIYNLAGGLVYLPPVYVITGTTPGFTPDTNSAIMDGTNGTADWRGWTPVVTRGSILRPGIDYSWNPETGVFQLPEPQDVFGNAEFLFIAFQLRTDEVPVPDVINNESLIASFVYYWYYRSLATQSTGIGEVQSNAENATTVAPRQKLIHAQNVVHYWADEFLEFMRVNEENSPTLYPEWTYRNRREAARHFAFSNPIF